LELHPKMEFETWAIAESYLNDYARLKGFCFRKRRRVADSSDDNITRRQTYECSCARTHNAEKDILSEDRRDRNSEMIGCPWHINLAFPKSPCCPSV
jgi:hypothetical protein